MKNLILVLTMLVTHNISAQKIEGQVFDEQNKALAYATVSLFSAIDSSWTDGTLTDTLGKFHFTLETETPCYLVIEFLGMEPLVISDIENAELAQLTLKHSAEHLEEILIKGKRPTITYKNGTLTYSLVENQAGGESGLDILAAVPLLRLDKDDRVILRGRVPKILIDGKDLQLGGKELETYLRSLSADQLKQIEVMTSPSAKYEAEGNSGIVNIVTRTKPQGHFTNLSLYTGYGQYGRVGGNINSSLQAEKLGVALSLSPYYGHSINLKNINRSNTLTGTKFEQSDTWLPKTLSLSGNISANYKLNQKNILSGFIKTSHSIADEETISQTTVSGDRRETSGINTSADVQDSYKTLGLSHEYKMDTVGSTLSIEYLRIIAGENNLSTQENHFTNDSTQQLFSLGTDNEFRFRINSFKIDLAKNIKGIELESGLKYAHVSNISKQDYILTETDKAYIPFVLYDDRYDYNEHISAAYLSAKGGLGPFSFRTGLRMEHTSLDGKSIQFGPNARSYTDLFPNLNVNYENGKLGNFSISYSRRISRPYYRNLNPAVSFIDLYTYSVGNPHVNPSYSNNMEVTYQKGLWVISAFNNISTGDIAEILIQDDQSSIVKMSPINMAQGIERGVELSRSFSLTDKTDLDVSLNYGYNSAELGAASEVQTFSSDYGGGQISLSHELGKKCTMKVYCGGDSAAQYGIWGSKFVWLSSFSLFWNPEPWSLSFKFNDPFNSNRWNSTLDLGHIQGSWVNRWESRKVSLSLKYRFGNNNMKNKGKYNKSTRSAESNRI